MISSQQSQIHTSPFGASGLFQGGGYKKSFHGFPTNLAVTMCPGKAPGVTCARLVPFCSDTQEKDSVWKHSASHGLLQEVLSKFSGRLLPLDLIFTTSESRWHSP